MYCRAFLQVTAIVDEATAKKGTESDGTKTGIKGPVMGSSKIEASMPETSRISHNQSPESSAVAEKGSELTEVSIHNPSVKTILT